MTERLATTTERETLVRTRKGLDGYVVNARQTSREIAEQVELFARRLTELRSIVGADGEVARTTSEPPLGERVHRQDQELTLALEELRAQNAALVESLAVLEEEHSRYVQLFDNAPDAYVTTDARGIIREANAAAVKLLGIASGGLPGKLLIAFVARRDTRSFRKMLGDARGSADAETRVFSLHIRPRGGVPIPASLSVRRATRPWTDAADLRWTIRPGCEPASDGERSLLRDIAGALRSASETSDSSCSAVVADIEQLADSVETGEREPLAPKTLVQNALAWVAAHAPGTEESLVVDAIEDGVTLNVAPERATWALGRLLALAGKGELRGRRSGSSYVMQLRTNARPGASAARVAYAAVLSALRSDGGRLRITPRTQIGEAALTFEVIFPLPAHG